MNITLVSAFRNSAAYIPRYFNQMDALQTMLNSNGYDLSLVLGYGDDIDHTGELLHEECVHRFNTLLVDVTHGGPERDVVVGLCRHVRAMDYQIFLDRTAEVFHP